MRSDLIEAGRKVLKQCQDGERSATLGDVARALDIASKLGRLAAGMPTEVKEVNTTMKATIDVDWEIALRRIYGTDVSADGVR